MVGLEVTPTTASSSIIRASSPPWISRRERKSIQTLWPSSDTWCKRDLAIRCLPFHLFDLFKPAHVALPPVEAGGEEGPGQLGGHFGPHHLRAQAEHVHV